LCCAAALLASGCGGLQLQALSPGTQDFGDLGQASLLRGHNFASLHPVVRELLGTPEAESVWVEHGLVELPLASCEGAVHFSAPQAHECSLIALAGGRSAVLVISKAGECSQGDCMEHSWAFLDVYEAPFALPPRRASDYRSLRQDLSREDASAVWLAGFRGRSEPTRFAELEPESAPAIASYRSCRVAPDQRELVCRSQTGDLIGLDPITSTQRLIAHLAVEPGAAQTPAWWTFDGQLAADAGQGKVALLAWPSQETSEVRLVAAAHLR